FALGLRGGEVVHVGRRAVAGYLGPDPRAAGPGVIHVLEQEHDRALAHDESVTAEVEWPACLLRLVVALAGRLDLAEGAPREGGDRGLGAAGQHGHGCSPLVVPGRL